MVFYGIVTKVGNSKAINLPKQTCDERNIEIGDHVTISVDNFILKRRVIKNKNCKTITLKKSFCKRLELEVRDPFEYEIIGIEKNIDDIKKDEFVGAIVR